MIISYKTLQMLGKFNASGDFYETIKLLNIMLGVVKAPKFEIRGNRKIDFRCCKLFKSFLTRAQSLRLSLGI